MGRLQATLQSATMPRGDTTALGVPAQVTSIFTSQGGRLLLLLQMDIIHPLEKNVDPPQTHCATINSSEMTSHNRADLSCFYLTAHSLQTRSQTKIKEAIRPSSAD